jgi:hypothetical protein
VKALALIAALVSLPAMAEPEAFGMPIDKVLHASISANLEMGCVAVVRGLGASPQWALGGCALGVLALGAAKELVWDLAMRRGAPEVADFAFDVLGTGAGLVVAGLVLRW